MKPGTGRGGLLLLAVLAIAVVVLAPRASFGDCGGNAGAFPSEKTPLPLNGRILFGASVEIEPMAAEIRSYGPELRASGDRVPLRVVETNVGVEQTQAVLVPERALRPNLTYTLSFTRDSKVAATQAGRSLKMPGNISWKTGSVSDTTPPRWSAPPKTGKPVYAESGCGPDSYVPIKVSFIDREPILVRAELRTAEKEKPRRFILEANEGALRIGRTMCGGAFDLVPKQRYLVTLTAIDVAGNESPAPGGAIEIVGPGPEDEKR